MSATEQEPSSEQEGEEVVLEVEESSQDELRSMMSDLRDDAEQATVTDYTAVLSGIQHGHGVRKGQGEGQHDVRTRWDVRDEFVAEHFLTQPNDHAAIYEMVMRRDEFEQADEALFEDAANDSASKWSSIERFAESGRAPIPDETRRKLRRLVEA